MSFSAPPTIRPVALAVVAPIATASPVVGSVIPAISAHEAKTYDMVFNQDVVYRSANGDPLYGSIGVSWWVHEDLHPVGKRLGFDRKALIDYVIKSAKRPAESTVRPTKTEASQLVDIFLFFNDPKQEFFFIKKGTSCQWLVRKTTSYYFEDVEAHIARGTTAYMPHRVGYQVIRKATAEESANQLGRGIQTLMIGGMTVSA